MESENVQSIIAKLTDVSQMETLSPLLVKEVVTHDVNNNMSLRNNDGDTHYEKNVNFQGNLFAILSSNNGTEDDESSISINENKSDDNNRTLDNVVVSTIGSSNVVSLTLDQ